MDAREQYDDEIDLMALAGTLWRGKWIIIIFMWATILMGGYYAFRIAVPMYPAHVSMVLEEDGPQFGGGDLGELLAMTGIGAGGGGGVDTELEVIQSRSIVGRLVDVLELDRLPEFNSSLRDPGPLDELLDTLMSLLGEVAVAPQQSEQQVRNDVITSVIEAIDASVVRGTNVIEVTITTKDPDLSVVMANTLSQIYIEDRIQARLEGLESGTYLLSGRIAEMRQDLEDLQTQLANFAEESEIVSPEIYAAQLFQLRELRDHLSDARERQQEASARLDSLMSLSEAGDIDAFIASADEFRLNRALAQYRDGIIAIDDLRADIDSFLLQMQAAVEREAEQVAALERSEADFSSQVQQMAQDMVTMQQLEREAEIAGLIYGSYSARFQQMNVQQGLEEEDIRILSAAFPMEASSPRKAIILALSGIIGMLFGAGIVLLREMRFAGFRTLDDIKDTGVDGVVGMLPIIPGRKQKNVIANLKSKKGAQASRSLQSFRTSLLMANHDHPIKVIMVTSSVQKEGKSTTSIGLARSLSGLGKKVLLIETDTASQVCSECLEVSSQVPLSDMIEDGKVSQDALPYVGEFGFHVIIATQRDVNTLDLLASDGFANLLLRLREIFDYIVIDTPPLLEASEARVIGARADASVYVVKWNSTTKTQMLQGVDMLSEVNVRVDGVVLNQVDGRKLKSYGYAGH